MQKEINRVKEIMEGTESFSPTEDIRESAKAMASIAIETYNDYLLKSALNMVASIAQFADDLDNPK